MALNEEIDWNQLVLIPWNIYKRLVKGPKSNLKETNCTTVEEKVKIRWICSLTMKMENCNLKTRLYTKVIGLMFRGYEYAQVNCRCLSTLEIKPPCYTTRDKIDTDSFGI